MALRGEHMINFRIYSKKWGQKGMVLMMAMIISSIVLLLGINIANIAAKQIYLTSFGKQSQVALFMADSMVECVLYWDGGNAGTDASGDYYFPPPASTAKSNDTITCLDDTGITSAERSDNSSSPRVFTFGVPSAAGGALSTGGNSPCAEVIITKTPQLAPLTGVDTKVQAYGYNTCNTSDPRRVQRGLQMDY